MEKQIKDHLIAEKKITDSTSQRQINYCNNQQIINKSNNIQIVNFILNFKDYYKIVSLNIQHHQKSINILPLPILTQFPQLSKRVELIINKSKFNVQFINQIIEPYNQLVYHHLLQKKERLNQQNKLMSVTDHCHDNHNYHKNHTLIMNIFYHLIREWSLSSKCNYFQIIISHIQSYLRHSGENDINEYQNTKILIIQCGMGRILKQLRKRFKQNKIQIQGHQSQIQLYLCAQYFLNRCQVQLQVYPYIHNFSNFLNNQNPYRKIVIPYQIESHIINYPLTFGNFTKIYRQHLQNWNIIVTVFNNYNIKDIMFYVKFIYKMLRKGGIWIDLCTASFQQNIIPMTYRQYQFILDNFKFKLLAAGKCNDPWFQDNKCLLNQKRVCYYRVMQK